MMYNKALGKEVAARRGRAEPIEFSALGCPTPSHPLIENIGKKPGLSNGFSGSLHPTDVEQRCALASALALAIGEAHPDDAVQLMAAALADLTPAGVRPDFFVNAEADARWWASIEPPEVLVAVLDATLSNLGNRAMHRETRKRLFLALWRGFDACERSRFLAFARGAA